MLTLFLLAPGSILVLDNHSAHTSNKLKALMLDKKVDMLFLPPNGSALNPVERVWAIFKQQWAKRLAGLAGEIRPWEMEKEVSAVL